MRLDGFDGRSFARRRAALGRALGGQRAVIASGRARSRNYAANTFAFRATSHFLYLVGLPLRQALLVWDGDAFALHLPRPGPDDALWHGAVPSFADLERATGVPVRALEDLPAEVAHSAATLPAPDLETCEDQARTVGRPVRPGVLEGPDARLAEALIGLRLVHDEGALEELRLAAQATAAAHAAGMRATRPGIRESNVRAAMETELVARGMTVAYGSIVTVHGEVLHNEEHDGALQSGDLLLADVGAETAGGWAGDVTRTWPVGGRFSSTQRDLYDVVLGAQKEAVAAVRPGVRYRDIHLGACRALAKGLRALGVLRGDPEELVADGVHALLFPHGIGHLIGLDVHDMEDLGDRAGYAPGRARSDQFGLGFLRLDRDLEPGMAVTIEPGLYVVPAILADEALARVAGDRLDRRRLAAFADVRGIRIEDDVVCTAAGPEVLTAAIPKERDAVEGAVGGER